MFDSKKRGRAAAWMVLPAAVLALGGLAMPAAAAATPAQDPTLLFEEGFEHAQGPEVTSLSDYAGANGVRYTADDFWLDPSACNGIVLQHDGSIPFAGVGSACINNASEPQNRLTELAQVLGGGSGTNHAVAAYTQKSGAAGQTLLTRSSGSGITLKAGHFYAMSIDVAEVNCFASTHSTLQFGLQLASGEVLIGGDPAVACKSGAATTVNGREVRHGTFFSNGFLAQEAGAAEVVVRNLKTDGSGNDFAYDNVRFYDVTPTLVKSFAADAVEVGQPVTMNLTVQNTSELGAKSGWSFTDHLPAGMSVASEPNVRNDCHAEVSTSDNTVGITGGALNRGAASCTISVDVVLAGGGDYTNVVDGMGGLTGSPSATVRGLVPSFELTKSASPDSVTAAGQHVTYTFEVRNTGDLPLHAVIVTDPGPAGGTGTMGDVICPESAELAVGGTLTCTADYVAGKGDLTGAPLVNVASAAATSPGGAALNADATASTATVVPVVPTVPSTVPPAHPAAAALAQTGGTAPIGFGIAGAALLAAGIVVMLVLRRRAGHES